MKRSREWKKSVNQQQHPPICSLWLTALTYIQFGIWEKDCEASAILWNTECSWFISAKIGSPGVREWTLLTFAGSDVFIPYIKWTHGEQKLLHFNEPANYECKTQFNRINYIADKVTFRGVCATYLFGGCSIFYHFFMKWVSSDLNPYYAPTETVRRGLAWKKHHKYVKWKQLLFSVPKTSMAFPDSRIFLKKKLL